MIADNGTGTVVAIRVDMSPLHTQLLLGAGAATFLLLIVLRRGLRHSRRIDVTCVSHHWLADHKRHLES